MTSPYITEPEYRPLLRTYLLTDDRRALTLYLRVQHHHCGGFLFHAGEGADQYCWVCRGMVQMAAESCICEETNHDNCRGHYPIVEEHNETRHVAPADAQRHRFMG